jgi:hypothetical protein
MTPLRLADFQPLTSAEERLVQACREGRVEEFAERIPQERTEENRIRASFLRFLTLGGDESAPVHDHGPELRGAWIEGQLDLEGARVASALWLYSCVVDTKPVLRDARFPGTLCLAGCRVSGIDGDRLACDGGLFLRNGFCSAGPVVLTGFRLGGVLDCSRGTFCGCGEKALIIERANIAGTAVLGRGFSAIGEVRILDAEIGQLDCGNGTFTAQSNGYALCADRARIRGDVSLNQVDGALPVLGPHFTARGPVSLLGARIGGDLRCEGGELRGVIFPRRVYGSCETIDRHRPALLLDRSDVKGSVFLTEGFSASGRISLDHAKIALDVDIGDAFLDGRERPALTAAGVVVGGRFLFRNLRHAVDRVWLCSAQVGALADDAKSWGEDIILDGFKYNHIANESPTDADIRVEWLKRQTGRDVGSRGNNRDFKPQPWRQLTGVLRSTGHDEVARRVGIAREKHLRKIGRIGQAPAEWWRPMAWLYRFLAVVFHFVFGVLVDYGYRPMKLVIWMLAVWLLFAGFYWGAAVQGVFAPTTPLVFNAEEYARCTSDHSKETTVPGGAIGICARTWTRNTRASVPWHTLSTS